MTDLYAREKAYGEMPLVLLIYMQYAALSEKPWPLDCLLGVCRKVQGFFVSFIAVITSICVYLLKRNIDLCS